MADNPARSVVFYVWDNVDQRLVRLYRAVNPEDLSRSPAAGFDGYFAIEHLDAFVSSWKQQYADERFVIRDWRAESAEDFYRTRLLWTADDVANHLPSNRAGSREDSPPPRLQSGGAKWEMARVELQTNSIGIPAGLPAEKERVLRAMEEYAARHSVRAPEDLPMTWFRLSAANSVYSLKVFDDYLNEKLGRVARVVVPRLVVFTLPALRKKYGERVTLNEDPSDFRFYFRTLEDEGLMNEWWVGDHRDEMRRAFGDLVA
ncbi:MAG: hypothetical protein ACHQ49_05185 [Elusimicrobiota bacterium]